MRHDPAGQLDGPRPAEEELVAGMAPPAPASAAGKRPRTSRLIGEPQVAEEPAPPAHGEPGAERERPIERERRPGGEAGRGSFMPPVRELMLARQDREPIDVLEGTVAEPGTDEEPEAAGDEELDDEELDDEELDDEELDDEELDGEELDDDPVVGQEVPPVALLSTDFVPADGAPPAQLDAVAIETELDSAIGAVAEPSGPDGKRSHLTQVAQLAGTRRRAALATIDGENAQVDLEEEEIGRRAADRSRDDAVVVESKRKAKVDGVHSKMAGKKATRAASRDELKSKLRAAQAADKMKAAETLAVNMFELETGLAVQLAGLQEEQKAQDDAIVLEFETKNAELAVQIEKKRLAHQVQIEREKVALELAAANQTVVTRAEAEKQGADIVASADAQAAYTLTESQIHAGNTEAKAGKEAQQAREAGEAKAQQAIQAADDRAAAAAADESEKASIAAEGESRANQARAQAESRAGEIESKGTADAASIRDKGEADSIAEKERGQRESVAAVGRGEGGVKRIEDELAAGIALMQVQSAMALAEMETERALAMVELEQARSLALTQMALDMALATAKLASERTTGVAALRTEHEKLVAAIDRTVETDLAKVDAAGDKDLAALERTIDEDLAAIESEAKAAAKRMKTAVDDAEARAREDTAARREHIRDAGLAVIGAIDGVVARAEGAIDEADEDTSQEIGDAAQVGVTSIALEGQDARDENQQASDTAIREQETAAQAARDQTSRLATDAAAQMQSDREALDGEIDQQWVDDAMARSGELLSRDGTDWAVTDQESVEAMHLMASLPPHLQGQVIDDLPDDKFEELLSEMDEDRHEDLEPLVDASTDPERKLEMWHVFQLSRSRQDAERNGDDFSEWVAEQNQAEIEEELELLAKKREEGTLTYDDVKELVTRKKLESQIEMQFRVNITAAKDDEETEGIDERFRQSGSDAGTRIVWTAEELVQMQAALDGLPESHVRQNPLLREINRQHVHPDNPAVGGDHVPGLIRVFDNGVDPKASYRHDGDLREGGGASLIGPHITKLEEVLVHEVGHDMHDNNPILYKAFQQAGGWDTDLQAEELYGAGFTPAELWDMAQNGATYNRDGSEYHYRYGQFESHEEGRIPATGHDPSLPGQPPRDTFGYARDSNPDHFAETYMKADLVPEQLAVDLLDTPRDQVANETIQRDIAAATREHAKARVATLQAASPPPPLRDLLNAYQDWNTFAADAAVAQQRLDEAEENRVAMEVQYRIMRDGIFQTGEAVAEAQADLEAKGIDPALVADFVDKAERLATPEQVAELKKNYV
jgi:hypothetical protein